MTELARKLAGLLACCAVLAAIGGCGHQTTDAEKIRREAAIDRGHQPSVFEKDVHITTGN